MKLQLRVVSLFAVALVVMACGPALAGVSYPDPSGGWTYTYEGADAIAGAGVFDSLDGTWDHDNGSDQWDGTGIGTGRPGGASALTADTTTYLRIQETGDPRDYGMDDPGSNRKLFFGHDITSEGASDTILDDGVTLSFRARIATTAPLDDAHPDDGGGITPWPAGGDGYVIGDGGKHTFGIKQLSGGLISFALANTGDTEDPALSGLLMNALNGTEITGDVDYGDGTTNLLPISDADLTEWQEFWVTIQADATGTGTNQVDVYTNGSLAPTTFVVTAGDGSDYADMGYIAMSLGSTGQAGAVDIDFMSYRSGAIAPVPEPSSLVLLCMAAACGLLALRRR
jgi:hypothetical protein